MSCTTKPSQAGGALEQDPVALRRDDRARFWPAPPRHAQGHDPVRDVVKTVSGRFSGSALFIFSQLRQGVPLSEALVAACGKGLCEPDPRDDLNDVDNARSLVVLGRDLGLELELSDVECDRLLPAELKDWSPSGEKPTVEQLCKAL